MVLFENRWQAKKVRWFLIGCLFWAAGFLYWAWLLSQTYGLSPGDGGALRPAVQRYGAALVVALLGMIPLAAAMVYSRVYLVRIERYRDAVRLVTIGMLWEGHRMHAPDDFRGSTHNEGRRMHARISVHAPWMSLYVTGSRLPYLVDLQAEYINRSAIGALARRRDVPASRNARRRSTK